MMKRIYLFFIGLSMLILSSASLLDSNRQVALGKYLPSIALHQNGNNTPRMLDEFKGKWVVLSFWSSTDAASRLNQSLINGYLREMKQDTSADEKFEFLSVNFDDSSSLTAELIRVDGLTEGLHFSERDPLKQKDFRSMFRMNEGLRTFLINPEGVLVATDLSVSELHSIIEG